MTAPARQKRPAKRKRAAKRAKRQVVVAHTDQSAARRAKSTPMQRVWAKLRKSHLELPRLSPSEIDAVLRTE